MAKIVQLENKVLSDTAEKTTSQDFVDDDEDEEYERYIPVEQSIIGSLLEVREMIAGRMPKKTWREVQAELDAEFATEERNMVNGHNRHKALQG